MNEDYDDETIDCPHCGAAIYEDSFQCPRCGQYLTTTPTSKRIPLWVLVIIGLTILSFSLPYLLTIFKMLIGW